MHFSGSEKLIKIPPFFRPVFCTILVTDNICLILHLCFQNSELKLQSKANVTVNARSSGGNITGQLFVGNDEVVVRNQKFSIKTDEGKNILYADKDKILFAADKLEFLSNFIFCFF